VVGALLPTSCLPDGHGAPQRVAQRFASSFSDAHRCVSLSEFVISAEVSGLVEPILRDGAVRAS
jgi:hypothetical protein